MARPHASRVVLATLAAAALVVRATAAVAEVDADTLRVIDETRACMRLRPLSSGHASARGRKKGVHVEEASDGRGLVGHVRRVFARLRWAVGVIVAYRLLKRTLDRFLPIPEDDETDALDYVDFEKFLYESTATPMPGEVTRLPLS
ncbi:hypothetical protein KFE25_006832 [Diacronema lutheri]|uniref:Uncharacterized protein n=1 Tax=Diacronema lutheri TaxID=2081491 RepID=A0A8J6CF96_DIALT|nr:hypothetical protein KFE25_006832 [Diacronema lutheri]